MLNYIWGGLILVSLVVSAFNGKLEATTGAAIEGAKGGLQMAITLLGIMMLWTGIMNIAKQSKLIEKIARFMRPLIKLLFPKLKPDGAAANAIVMNMVANALGMSNAATPLGLAAMRELDKLNPNKDKATNEMCMLVVINTASIQILPVTIIALRQAAGSADAFSIVVPVWIASLLAVTAGVTAAKIFAARDRGL